MEKKMKIRNLKEVINDNVNIIVYRSLTSHISDDFEDLYKGSFKCIPDTLKDCDIYLMYPSVQELPSYIPYICIQIG